MMDTSNIKPNASNYSSYYLLKKGVKLISLQEKKHSDISKYPLNLFEDLTQREKQILELVANDMTDKEIAYQLELSVRTVNNYLWCIYNKLQVKGRTGAVVNAILNGIIFPDISYE